ncbi:MAG: cysteine desulfurase family protein, partial [Patescibacteria group bacterium]
MQEKKIYLDNAATTPVSEEVLKEMFPYFSVLFGNASSFHSFGHAAAAAVGLARERAAKYFGVSPEEIVFTSGATESNNLAIKGAVKRFYELNRKEDAKPHIITSSFEHHCVLDSCKAAEKEGLAEVTFLLPEADGVMDAKKVMAAIKPNTILISLMYVNNEIGTVQPIAELGELIKEENKKRGQKIIFHTDATQAIDYFDCHVDRLGVGLLSMSAHKIYGPKGIGLLYIKKGTPITKIQTGGGQEGRMRAGTLNVPGIVGLGKAISMIDSGKNKKVADLRDYLINRILKEIPDTTLNGSCELRSPNNANISFKNVEGESLLMLLDMHGIAVSTGSACS